MSNISTQLSRIFVGVFLSIMCMSIFAQTPQKNSLSGQKLSVDELKEKRLKWFRDARFGMMIHWGLYSVPAGTWASGS